VIWWSVISALTSMANSVASFSLFRTLLGIGEGFNWPGASKTAAEYFAPEERGVAVAIFDSGSSVGGALASLSIPWIALRFGWRSTFFFSGALGLLWLAWWLAVYPRERSIRESVPRISLTLYLRQWFPLLLKRNTWVIVLARSLTDPVWWFYVFWLPQYLSDARGFSLKQIAEFSWIPFVAADLGNFAGGFLSRAFVTRGAPVLRARKLVCLITAVPMLSAIPASLASTPALALTYICIALFGYAAFATMGLTLPSDLFPADVVASITGLSGLGAGLAGAGFTLLVGVLVDKFSYTPAFFMTALVPLLATAAVWFLARDSDRVIQE
jgi:ACS family hexuronate transporter-like MFS transporter